MTRFVFVLLLAVFTLGAQAASMVPSPPQVSAKSYILMDANSGVVLAEHNADLPLPPASLTKMMNSYVLAHEMEAGRVTKDDMVVRMAVVDEYVLPPDVTQAYVKAPRTEQKSPSKFVTDGKWKGYTPPPMPK